MRIEFEISLNIALKNIIIIWNPVYKSFKSNNSNLAAFYPKKLEYMK